MELDVLKKNWNDIRFASDNKEEFLIQLPKLKKSISSVKTVTKRLFTVSMLEFITWGIMSIGLHFLFKDSIPQSFLESRPLIFVEKLNYLALGLFLIAFLISFKAIDIIGDLKLLLSRIILTKRIVSFYIYYNISIFIVTFLFSFTWELFNNEQVGVFLTNRGAGIYALILFFGIAFTIGFALILFKLYQYVYGRFVIDFNRLAHDLKELNKDEVLT